MLHVHYVQVLLNPNARVVIQVKIVNLTPWHSNANACKLSTPLPTNLPVSSNHQQYVLNFTYTTPQQHFAMTFAVMAGCSSLSVMMVIYSLGMVATLCVKYSIASVVCMVTQNRQVSAHMTDRLSSDLQKHKSRYIAIRWLCHTNCYLSWNFTKSSLISPIPYLSMTLRWPYLKPHTISIPKVYTCLWVIIKNWQGRQFLWPTHRPQVLTHMLWSAVLRPGQWQCRMACH